MRSPVAISPPPPPPMTLGVDPHVDMPEAALGTKCGLTTFMSRAAVTGLTLVAAQRSMRAVTRKRAGPISISLPIQSNSAQGRGALEIDMGAEAPRIDVRAHDPLQIGDAGQADQRKEFLRGVGEHVPGGFQQFGRAADHLFAGPVNRELAGLFVEGDAQLGQLLVTHRHQEVGLGPPLGRLGVEGGQPRGRGRSGGRGAGPRRV